MFMLCGVSYACWCCVFHVLTLVSYVCAVSGDMRTPLSTIELERVNYTPIPRYDEDTRILWIANSGGVSMQLVSR